MFNPIKRSKHINEEDFPQDRRKSADRRISDDETRFPHIDDDYKLVMKDRRIVNRRSSSVVIKSPLQVISKIFKR